MGWRLAGTPPAALRPCLSRRHAASSCISCEPGITSGASQKAYQRFLSITSCVISMPAALQRVRLVVGHPADAAHDVIFRREVLSQRRPLAASVLHRQIAHDRLAAVDRVACPHLRSALAAPRHHECVLLEGRGQPGHGLVL